MTSWNQNTIHPHMKVYATDKQHVGHVAAAYEDSFLVHKGYLFATDRYLPYSLIAGVEGDEIRLSLTAEQLQNRLWTRRPDYENHLGDPTQLFYDRGHGVRDPFDESGTEHPITP